MNYVNFMRKIEGKEPHHDQQAANSTTSGPRPLDLQGIIEFARGQGYPDHDLEARPEVPTNNRADFFWAGYDGLTWSDALGLYSYGSYTNYCFYSAGRHYQREQGDTHSQQQDSVPVETPRGDGGSDWIVNGDDVNLDEIRAIIRRIEQFSYVMGRETPQAQPREEPEGVVLRGAEADAYIRSYDQLLRSTLDPEESGVQGVRDEREGGERSRENTQQYYRRSLERGTGG
tara:strand:+ start:107 stop:796 length:690 start_codon:yes stop_codon:yes gene_type:complete